MRVIESESLKKEEKKEERTWKTPALLIRLQCIHQSLQRKSPGCRHYLTTDVLNWCMQRHSKVYIWDIIVELVNGMDDANLINIQAKVFR